MATNKRIAQAFMASILLMLGVNTLSLADDTDIYTGGSLSGASLPNIVYTIDTSGSMRTTDMDRGATYDPNRTYNGYCDPNRYYWGTGTTIPDCRTAPSSNYIDAISFHCDAAASGALAAGGAGTYTGKFARDSGVAWLALSTSDHTSAVECEADYGVHGSNTAPVPDVYPSKTTGGTPWTSNTTNAFDWAAYSSTYTFYSGNYVNWSRTDRLSVVMDVYIDLLTTVANSGVGINIGLMRFDSGSAQGGYFIVPLQQLTPANLQTYTDAVLALRPDGSTPLTETLYEAYLFYTGQTARYGDSSSPGVNPTSMYSSGTTYISPIDYQCQKNFVIMLTDGAPTSDTDANSLINNLPGVASCSNKTSGACLDELAGYMFNNDCSTAHSGKQNVITYTIGFSGDASGLTLLQNTATAGGGEFFPANDAAALTESLAKIIVQVKQINSTFTAPAVSVNAYNRNFHNDDLYYALFKPEPGPSWPGNIKVYKLSGLDIVDAQNPPQKAVDPTTGFIKSTAVSYWSAPLVDGSDVRMGGAASQLTTTRNVYTYTGSAAPNNVNLTSYPLNETNSSITATMLGDPTMTTTDRTNMLKWARGIDVKDEDADGLTTDARQAMGDPLHSRPAVISYGPNPDDLALFVGTNEGFLHALDTKDGSEIFAFMPKELLPGIRTRYLNATLSAHVYGLDGQITYWHNDANHDGYVKDSFGTTQAGEFVYLYQGMRRGGNSYYAYDVTDLSTPKLKWQITGGASGTTGFSELGQTWSTMVKAKIKLNGIPTDVLIFGGGYDTAQDVSGNTHTTDSIGRAIYMVDATTGAKLWQAGPAGTALDHASNDPDLVLSDMTNSIPSDIVVFDTNRDGFQDRMYAADVGGQIWRFDLDIDGNTGASTLATGGLIARLNGTTAADNRRFYHAPEVALSSDGTHMTISIGSGQRARPLDKTVHDAFFMLKDPYVYTTAKDSGGSTIYTYVDTNSDGYGDSIITMSNLFDATDNLLGSVVDGTTVTQAMVDTARQQLADAHGWYLWLHDLDASNTPLYVGEKVTAEATVIKSILTFVTYTPVETTSSTACQPSQGRGRIYIINLANATPTQDLNGDGTIDANDRIKEETPGMLGRVQNIITTKNWSDCSGLKCYEGGSITPRKAQWSME